MEEVAISIQNVTKRFKSIVAVNDLSIDIPKGEFIGLLGPNGAGKTTLIEMIEGIQKPDSGQISIMGKNWQKHEKFLRGKIGLALQETRFTDKLTVFETLKLFGSFHSLKSGNIKEILELVQLDKKQNDYVVNLSGGQRQKLALGIAIINKPEVLLLDEPTTGLDPSSRRDIWKILKELHNNKTTIILTTHYMEEAEYLCQKIIVLYSGKILAMGSLQELLSHSGEGEVVSFRTNQNTNPQTLIQQYPIQEYIWNEEKQEGRFKIKDISKYLSEFLDTLQKNDMELIELDIRKTTLDDLFLSMTGRGLIDESDLPTH
ncbi:MAG: ABC transporter ATP-binding protein [Leptospiraceae bacterium]|nr:ABC transporter ATP-binding protein [Leptospiraceae bacterium]MCP5493122.1 ABC transporter ATP-binding protein [Leptospiraceae bacterium]